MQNQLQKLHAIALQCPLEGGIAVHKARSMVGFYTQVNYEKLQNCNSNAAARPRVYQDNADLEIIGVNTPIQLYPNPASHQVILDWELTEEDLDRSLIVTNALGQVVYQQRINASKNVINTRDWTAGLYICKMYEGAKAVQTEKLIINQP